ncbi:mechanosensitive ion channel family protein [Paraglaciecola sp.]|uniref:mechanosensitive ion channel family protein n=1 Tax=Paraglaciecola sp. TaxID=1920173 RepID=UPI0030F3E0D2
MGNTWETTLITSYEQLISYLVAYVPQILGALILLILGWVIAWLAQKMTTSLLNVLSKLANGIGHKLLVAKKIDIKPHQANLAGKVVFWIVMLFFFAAATSSLGMDFIASWLKEFLSYVPRILAAGVIVLCGFLIGSIASSMATSAAYAAGLQHSKRIGAVVKVGIIFLGAVIGIEQLGVNIHFITTIIIVQLGVLSFGVALAYGFGSSELVKNLAGARQAKKHFKHGDRLRIGEFEGQLLEISSTMLILDSERGKTLVPARLCLEASSLIIDDEQEELSVPPEAI